MPDRLGVGRTRSWRSSSKEVRCLRPWRSGATARACPEDPHPLTHGFDLDRADLLAERCGEPLWREVIDRYRDGGHARHRSALDSCSPGEAFSFGPMDLNLATAHEAIAAAIPDRECIVFRDRRLTWAEVTDRTRRLANALLRPGPRQGRRACSARRARVGPGPPRPLPLQRQRVPRGDARRVQGAGRAVQRQLPLRRRGAALPARRRRARRRSSTTSTFAPTLADVRAELPALTAAAPGRRRVAATTCSPAPVGTRTRSPRRPPSRRR